MIIAKDSESKAIGASYGKLAYELWKTHGISRSPSALYHFVFRQKRKDGSFFTLNRNIETNPGRNDYVVI